MTGLAAVPGGEPGGLKHGESPSPLLRYQEEIWYFTFGIGHPLAWRYVRLRGTVESTRELMISIFGTNWARQYAQSEGRKRTSRPGMTELDLGLDREA